MKRQSNVLLSLVLTLTFVSRCFGQTATGVPPFSSVVGSSARINVEHLNIDFGARIFSRPVPRL